MEMVHSDDLVVPTFTERHLKVATDYARPIKSQNSHAPGRKIPSIQLKGQWLQQAGFEVNDCIKVRVIEGCLVITRPDAEPSAEDEGYVYPSTSTRLVWG